MVSILHQSWFSTHTHDVRKDVGPDDSNQSTVARGKVIASIDPIDCQGYCSLSLSESHGKCEHDVHNFAKLREEASSLNVGAYICPILLLDRHERVW
jgi:hypothetical protein